MNIKYYILFVLCLVRFSSYSQGTVSGTVHDAEHHPVPFASVKINQQITSADVNGKYAVQLSKKGLIRITADAFGYLHFEDSIFYVGNDTVVDIHLVTDIVELDSIILVAKKDDFYQKNKVVKTDKISKQELKEQRTSSLSTTLESVAGVNSVAVTPSVTKPIVRGLEHYRLAIVEDNIAQEGQQWGDDHGLELNQYSIEEVNIYKGISSLRFNSGVGGSIVVKRFKALPVDDHKLSAQFNFESLNNSLGLDAGIQGNADNLLYKFIFSRANYEDYKVPATSYQYLGFNLPIEKNRLANTSGENNHFFGLLGLKRKKYTTTLSYSRDYQLYGLFGGAEGIPRFYNLDISNSKDFELPFRYVLHQKVISNTEISLPKAKLSVDLAFQQNDRKEFENPLAHGFLNEKDSTGIDLSLQTYSGNIIYKKYYDKSELSFGITGKYQQNVKNESFDHFVPSYIFNEVSGFTTVKKYVSDKLVFSAGLRLDRVSRSINESSRSFYYGGQNVALIRPNPSFDYNKVTYAAVAGVSYQQKKTNLKLSVKRFARMPTIAELSANGNHHGAFRFERGTNDLNPEVGISLNSSIAYASDKLKISCSPYFTYFKNFIYLSPQAIFPTVPINGVEYPYVDAGQLYQYTESRASHAGLECSIAVPITKHIKTGLDAEYLFATDIDRGLPLPFIPQNSLKHFTKFTTDKVLDKTYIYWRNNFYSSQNRVSKNELETPSFYRADIFLGTQKKTKIGKLDLSVQVRNLFNANYYYHLNPLRRLGIPEPARNLSFQLIWEFYYHKHHSD